MVDLQTISLIVQIIGVSATATAAVVGVRGYLSSNKRAEESKRKEQETRNREVETQKQNLDTRQAQLFMQIFQRFQEPEFVNQWNSLMNTKWSDNEDYWNRLGWDPIHAASRLSVQTYFEGVAVLLMKKMIDVDFVYELMPTMATTFWKKYESVVREGRRVGNYPQWFRPVEYLSDLMVEQAVKRGDPVVTSYRTNSGSD